MVSIPPALEAQMAVAKQNVAMEMIKQANDAQKGLVAVLEQMAQNVPVSESQGTNLDTRI
jgi:hypothetical protein